MNPRYEIEEGIKRCCQNQKDSWRDFTGHLWNGIILMMGSVIMAFINIDEYGMSLFYIALGFFCAAFTVYVDRYRTHSRSEWDKRIADWLELRGEINAIGEQE